MDNLSSFLPDICKLLGYKNGSREQYAFLEVLRFCLNVRGAIYLQKSGVRLQAFFFFFFFCCLMKVCDFQYALRVCEQVVLQY